MLSVPCVRVRGGDLARGDQRDRSRGRAFPDFAEPGRVRRDEPGTRLFRAYVPPRTSAGDEGYGLAFTVGRGNDVQVAAVRVLVPLVAGMPVDDALADLGG